MAVQMFVERLLAICDETNDITLVEVTQPWVSDTRRADLEPKLEPSRFQLYIWRLSDLSDNLSSLLPQAPPIRGKMGGFGDFTDICHTAPLPLCPSVGPITSISSGVGISTDCFARNIELANTIIFEGASSFMHIIAMGMTIIMILHIRGKFTAVGRKEVLAFFYIYMLLSFFSLLVDAGVIPPGSDPYPYFVAIQAGFTSALVTCLLINGFVGFQLYEDGTPLSVWMLRVCSAVAFIISFLVSLATFKSWAGMGPTNTVGLFAVVYLLNGIQLVIYVGMQILLVVRTLEDRWPLGDIAFGVFFFVVGQVILYALSSTVCENTSHYVDGLFFATTCNLLAVMMVYKYWDSITKEDLEFSVGTRMNNWEVKEPLMDDERRTTVYADDPYSHSGSYDHSYSPSRNRTSRY
ncbi:chitin synthase export chaperone [Xylariaceae sp. FL0016]|nr:chitin synthase export chaperone [Xylariaceae sp. FL0016]